MHANTPTLPQRRPTSPRAFAQLILAAESKAAQNTWRAQIPAQWRDLVQTYVSNALSLRRSKPIAKPPSRLAAVPLVVCGYRAPVQSPRNVALAAHYLDAARATLTLSGATS